MCVCPPLQVLRVTPVLCRASEDSCESGTPRKLMLLAPAVHGQFGSMFALLAAVVLLSSLAGKVSGAGAQSKVGKDLI